MIRLLKTILWRHVDVSEDLPVGTILFGGSGSYLSTYSEFEIAANYSRQVFHSTPQRTCQTDLSVSLGVVLWQPPQPRSMHPRICERWM